MAPSRRRSLIVPREHGAWGILLVPLASGAAAGVSAGGNPWPLLPLTIAAVALFWLRTPVESWMGTTPIRARSTEELRLVKRAVLALASISLLALAGLFGSGGHPQLWWIGAIAATAFAAQAAVKKLWRGARIAAQMVGAVGLTCTAPAAYSVITGRLDNIACMLWAANFLFAANQIHFVQTRIHGARLNSRAEKLAMGRSFLVGQVVLAVLVVFAGSQNLLHWYAALAFAPLLLRGFAWFVRKPRPLAVHALGWSELAFALGFCVLLVLGT
jgi:hypothetical protein